MKLALMEIGSYIFIFLVWYIFCRALKRDITGDMLVGTLFGIFNEFTAEPITDYYFKINFYKDIPIIIPIAWGMMFALTIYLSEKLYALFLNQKKIVPGDKRILLLDLLSGLAIGFPLETLGSKSGLWKYNFEAVGWDLGKIPFLDMPLEVLVAYGLLMLTGPTVVRYWEGSFEGRL